MPNVIMFLLFCFQVVETTYWDEEELEGKKDDFAFGGKMGININKLESYI